MILEHERRETARHSSITKLYPERREAEQGSTVRQRLQTQSPLMFGPQTGTVLNKDVSVTKTREAVALREGDSDTAEV